ncbi:MAG: hypothetical protein EPN93_07005 [Spirochaetes bacterium]|nr:MAG: hypothetical protein EPN93_07005 [Spirochaetota bacterium]
MKTITSTRNLKIESALRVYKRGFGYAKVTVIDVNEYFLAMQVPEDLYEHAADGDTLDGYLWREDIASYEFKLQVKGKILVKAPILLCAHADTVSATKERKCLTAKVSLPVKYYPISVNHAEKSFYTEEIVMHDGTITEISDRDAVLSCSGELPVGHLLNAHLPIGTPSGLEITARVISRNGEGREAECRIEYMGIHEKVRGAILDYVFTVYRE